MNLEKVIINLLERYNVTYWTEGKNVSRDSINIQCPFRDCGDHSNHLGIFKDSLLYNCWKCRKKGHLSYLLTRLTSMSTEEAEEEIKEEKIRLGIEEEEEEDNNEDIRECVTPLPKFFEVIDEKLKFPLLDRYLKRRNLTREQVMEKRCGICRVGEYMNRMVIPVTYEGRQVSFVAADMTGTAYHKYMNPGSTIRQYLYGYDSLKSDIVVITEGILDAWRVGIEGTALFGSFLTDRQKTLILEKHPGILVFCLDGDAYWNALEQASFFEPYIERVEVIRMDFEEDPDKLGTEEIWGLIGMKLFPEEEE